MISFSHYTMISEYLISFSKHLYINDHQFKSFQLSDDDASDEEIEEASDEDKEDEEEESEGDAEEALTKQYQQEVEQESSSETEDDGDIDPEKKKLAKEKVNTLIKNIICMICNNLFYISTILTLVLKIYILL